jgi:hypothetical protein
MAQERTRPPGVSPPEPAESVGTDPARRTYDEEEVVRILQRAARLDREEEHSAPTLTLEEIESIARESGIDRALVRRAAGELENREDRGWGTLLAGAPLRRVVERVVDGEIGTEDHEALVMLVRSTLAGSGAPGMAASGWGMPSIGAVGRSLLLTGWSSGGVVEVQIAPRKGKTFIRIESSSAGLAGGVFGGIIGGIGGGVGSNVGWMLPNYLHWPVVAGLAGAAAVVLGAYGLARSIFSRQARALHRRMDQLAERLAAEMQEPVRTPR